MQNTTANFWVILFGLAILFLFLASFVAWVAIGMAKFNGMLTVPNAEERKLAPWGLIDILVAVVAFVFMQVFFAGLAIGLGIETFDGVKGRPAPESLSVAQETSVTAKESIQETSSESNDSIISESAEEPPPGKKLDLRYAAWMQSSALIAMALATLWIALRCQISIGRVGWTLRRIGWDVLYAAVAIVLFIPAVYLLMAAASLGFKQEYNHPIFEMVGKNLWLIGFAAWMAVVVAPLTEEFFFRVLLQGYLESMAAGKVTIIEVILGRSSPPQWIAGGDSAILAEAAMAERVRSHETNFGTETDSGTSFESNHETNAFRDSKMMHSDLGLGPTPTSLSSNNSADPYVAPKIVDPFHQLSLTTSNGIRYVRLAWWPVMVTGPLFGLAHFEYGVSWIPLTFLGIILGLLYRMTHRIWPSLLVHMFVNSVAMLGLATKIVTGAE